MPMKLTLFVIAGFLYFGGIAHAGDYHFTLINKTGIEIFDLHFSPASQEKWGEEVLVFDTLPHGEKKEIHLLRQEKADTWDIRAMNVEETAYRWSGLNLADVSTIVLTIKAGEPMAFSE